MPTPKSDLLQSNNLCSNKSNKYNKYSSKDTRKDLSLLNLPSQYSTDP